MMTKAQHKQVKQIITQQFNLKKIIYDLNHAPWEETEKGRQDRLAYICPMNDLYRLIEQHDQEVLKFSKKTFAEKVLDKLNPEDQEQDKLETIYQASDDWTDKLSDILTKEAKEHCYCTMEHGNLYAGQYREEE